MARDEVVRHVRDLFARLDANRDGYLTRAEIEAAHQSMMGAMHAGMGKRFADRGVPPTDRAAMFDRLDANHDGSITREEFMAARPPMQQRRMVFMRAGPDGGPGAPGGPGMKMRMHRAGMRFGGRLFDMADANRDGRVSLAEAQAAALRHFDRLDLNHDGVLSPEERQQAHQFMRERHPS
jgi:Ca2+-binding EF-hand superfamily protein